MRRSRSDVLNLAKEEANFRRVRFTSHAQRQMHSRNAQSEDVRNAILTAKEATYQAKEDTWKLTEGHDLDGDPLTVVIAIDPMRVITVM